MDSMPPEAASVPPPRMPGQGLPKRPWYLVGALLLSWIFGAAAFVDGCSNASILHSGRYAAADKLESGADETIRAAAILANDQYLDVWFGARNRLYPLSVATFLLGAALVWAAARAMAGRPSARGPVIQIALAQAVLAIVTFILTPDVRAAQITLALARANDGSDPEATALFVAHLPQVARVVMVGYLVVRCLLAVAIVVSLTRPQAREFFEATERRLSER
jgi:hypothetical protein